MGLTNTLYSVIQRFNRLAEIQLFGGKNPSNLYLLTIFSPGSNFITVFIFLLYYVE